MPPNQAQSNRAEGLLLPAPGVGSVFELTMPLELADGVDIRQRTARQIEERSPGDYSALRVLVVEDDAVSRIVIRGMLGLLGVAPDVAVDGLGALKFLSQVAYDIVFLDINMPHMSGLTVASKVRAGLHVGSPPILIAVTANQISAEASNFSETTLDGYLPKPIELADIELTLRALLAHHEMVQASASAESYVVNGPQSDRNWSNTFPGHDQLPHQEVAPIDRLPHQEVAPIDLASLTEIIGSDLVPEVIGIYLSDSRQRLTDIREGIVTGDAEKLLSTVHALSGASGYIRATIVHQLSSTLEELLRSQSDVDLDWADRLERAVDQVEAWLLAR